MVNVMESRKGKLNGCDRMALVKYSETYMEFSYMKASSEDISMENVSWEEKKENPRNRSKTLSMPKR